MKSIDNITLKQVQTVYSGPEGDLWELVMGQQIHVGGLTSSMDLAEKAHIPPDSTGVDLCCCNGAGMRFLLRFRNVAKMLGVDATEHVIQQGMQRCSDEGFADRTRFILCDVTDTGLPDADVDFVWGEDAWCYVVDKPALIREAVRLTRPGGIIAFTDWVEGPEGLTDEQAGRFLSFMKFPNIQDIDGYRSLLESSGCSVSIAQDTGRFASYCDLYIDMLTKQLTYDALRIIGFDMTLMEAMGKEMDFMRNLAHDGRIAQGVFVARKD